MKKRLTAWLLVFCMALSLLPGTAFAAEGGGEVTITYDLNDLGASTYQLQLKTTSGQKPLNEPGALWAGRPFAGWSSSPTGDAPPVYDGTKTLYAIWQRGYKVTFDFGTEVTLPPNTEQTIEVTTDSNGMVLSKDLKTIDATIKAVEAGKTHAFAGWFIDGDEDRPLDPATQAIPENGATLIAKWTGVYEITINYYDYDQNGSLETAQEKRITDAKGKITGDTIETPKREGLSPKGWYILETENTNSTGTLEIDASKYKWITLKNVVVDKTYQASVRAVAIGNINDYQFQEDVTVSQVWGEPYKINFYANGGPFREAYFTQATGEDKDILGVDTANDVVTKTPVYVMPSPDPVYPFHTFEGWYDKPGTTGTTPKEYKQGDSYTPGTSPTNLYAKWKDGYKITFEFWGKDSSTDPDDSSLSIYTDVKGQIGSAEYAKILQLSSEEKKGYVFLGWYDKADSSQTIVPTTTLQGKIFTSPVTYVGKWAEGYRVVFDKDSVGYEMPAMRTDTDIHLSGLADLKGEGREFDGWYVVKKDGTEVKAPYVTLGDKSYYDLNNPDWIVDVLAADGTKTGEKQITLRAKWTGPYTIKFDSDGGSSHNSITTGPANSADGKFYYPATLPTPTRTDHKFLGWYETDEQGLPTAKKVENNSKTPLDKPMTLKAKWEAVTVKVIFDPNGGGFTDGSKEKVPRTLTAVDGKINWPANPSLTSNDFLGWFTEKTGGTQVNTNQVFHYDADKDISEYTLYAQWSGITTTALTAPKKQAAKPASVMAAPSTISPLADGDGAETKVKVTFDPDYTDPDTGKPKDKQTVEASDEGKLTSAQIPKPIRTGYTFLGWFKDGETTATEITTETEFKADTTFKAKWQKGYLIHFNLVSTEGDVQPASIPDAWTDTDGMLGLKLPEANPAQNYLVREGYTFKGWSTTWPKSDGTTTPDVTDKYKFKEEFTIYAVWAESNNFKIKFYLNDGTDTFLERNTNDDGTVQLPSPTRDGYVLLGWFTEKENGQKLTADRVFDKNSGIYEFYAHWDEEFTVTFHENYPDGTGSTKTVTGSKTDFKLPDTPVLGGYVFTGWYDKNGNGPLDKGDINKDTKDLYAHWRKQEVTVKLQDKEQNSTIPDDTLTTTNGVLARLPQLFKEGYEFLGWFTEENGGGKQVGPSTVLTYDENNKILNLYAHWRKLTDKPDPNSRIVHFIVDKAVETDPSKAAHFTMIADTDGKYLSQTPVLVNFDSETDGWIDGEGIRVDRTYDFNDPNTNVYVNMANKFPITFDWNNAGVNGSTSDKEVIHTNLNGTIPIDQWPDSKAAEMYPDSSFQGWFTAATGGNKVVKTVPFTAATTIYAQWKSPYWITFDANGGTFQDGETTIKVKTDDGGYLASADVPKDPTIDSISKFMGWGLTQDAGPDEAINPATDKQPYDKPTVLYAIWGPPYKIEYQVNGGDPLTPTAEQSQTTDDGKFPALPTPTHSRDSFGGWYTTEDCTGSPVQAGDEAGRPADCTKPIILYAKWNHEPPYNITFNANLEGAVMEDPTSGSSVTTLTLKTDDKGVLMQAPPEPTIRGGKFQGWYTKPEEGTGELISDVATRTFEDDTTLYAHWDTMEFTITFDFNLSSIGKDFNITTYTTTKGKSLSFLPGELPQAASETKKIEGWYTVPNPVVGKDQPVTTSNTFERDTTLYAKWVDAPDLPIVFKYPNVTFLDAENGNAMVTLEVDKDYKMASVPPGPYKEGLTFTGWFYREPDRPDGEEKQFTKDTEVTGSLRVYPKYVGSGYTITFEPGEESELDPIEVKTTSEGRIPDGSMPSPTWEGHTFTGWYTSAEGGTRITRRTVFTQDTTVYAHWDKDGDPDDPNNPDNPDQPDGPTSPPFTITFDANGGNLTTASTALTDMNGRLMSLPTPLRTGYRLNGWYKGNERVTTATVFTANTTITAQWTTGTGGGSGDSGDINGYAITVANTTGGRVNVSTTYAREGDRVTVTVRPYSGYQLDRLDVTNARGYDVDLRDQGSNRYVFYMPASRVTVDAVFMELVANSGNTGNSGDTGGSGSTGGDSSWNPGGTVTPPSGGGATSGMGIFSQPVLNTVPMPYLDVHASDWYYSSVDYMWQRQLMGGVSSNRFGPQSTTSNAMVWTILARLAGVDVTSGASVWYENARSWAVSNRISDGVGPNSPVTREQLATMLWNYKGSPAVGYDLGQFGDRGQISTYQAECALRWAVANNIVSGTGNRLNPRGTATRAEVAAMITRFCQNT